jgi:hypothetical protein
VAVPALLFWLLQHYMSIRRHEAEVLACALGAAGITSFLIRRLCTGERR